jgi:hypothetical protein
MAVQFQERRDTAANWTAANPILANGEKGYETDTGKEKRGDGSTAWASLPYLASVAYVLPCVHLLVNGPADSTTYYFGVKFGVTMAIAAADTMRYYIPKSGTIKVIYGNIHALNTTATAETSTISFRLNNTTDTFIANGSYVAANNPFSNTALSIAVAAGDYFEIKVVTPAWVTNPGPVVHSCIIYIEV